MRSKRLLIRDAKWLLVLQGSFIVLPIVWLAIEYFIPPVGSLVLVFSVLWTTLFCVGTLRIVLRRDDPDALTKPLRIAWIANVVFLALILVSVTMHTLPCTRHSPHHPSPYACANNLRIIDSGKEQWAVSVRMTTGAVIKANANLYIKGNATPTCPDGGVYHYNALGSNPTCSMATFTGRPEKSFDHSLLLWRDRPCLPKAHRLHPTE